MKPAIQQWISVHVPYESGRWWYFPFSDPYGSMQDMFLTCLKSTWVLKFWATVWSVQEEQCWLRFCEESAPKSHMGIGWSFAQVGAFRTTIERMTQGHLYFDWENLPLQNQTWQWEIHHLFMYISLPFQCLSLLWSTYSIRPSKPSQIKTVSKELELEGRGFFLFAQVQVLLS